MSWQNNYRAMQASERRWERESQRQYRELQRRAKEEAKLSELEQARLEVETYQNWVDVLLSMHKEQSEPWDWNAFKAALPSPYPQKTHHHEEKIQQRILILPANQRDNKQTVIEHARQQDEEDFQRALERFSLGKAELESMQDLSTKVLAGEHKAYYAALAKFNPFKEISELCSKLRFSFHSKTLMACVLKVKGGDAIPSEVKILTAGGKVSVKPMPRTRFHEFYQDCLCSCILRVAREVFAMLPIETLLITASADSTDPSTGKSIDVDVLSVVMTRSTVVGLDFERLNPSGAMENFTRRGDFKASRKSGAFIPITPLSPADIAQSSAVDMSIPDLFANARRLCDELKAQNNQMSPGTVSPALEEETSL